MTNEDRKDCPYRTDTGNCLPHGGFCTSVNDDRCKKHIQDALEKQIQTEKLADSAFQIIDHYGVKKQLIKLSEELGELQTEVARMILKMEGVETRGSRTKLCEELADVLLLAEEFLSYSSDDADVVWHTMNFKALRTLERIQEER